LLLPVFIFGAFFLLSSVFASQEKSGLKFSHKLHVVENGMDCVTCHSAAETSTSGTQNLLPDMEVCGQCHDVESEDNCKLCHTNVENPQPAPRVENYNILFSHKQHLTAGLNCMTCHKEVAQQTNVEPYVLPDMAFCMTCHEERAVSTNCRTCHTPNERLKPLNHGPNFLHVHGDLASLPRQDVQTAQNCNLCHAINFCEKCHEGDNLDRTSHPLNYAFTHSLDARGKEHTCTTCHTDRSFCADCHVEYLVMPQNHTLGWAIPYVGGQHVNEAQSDLGNCLSCHEQNAEQTCQKSGCHSK
ncbi:MAG: cytochrome c3 family protein, partial [Calditrichia bacterium]